MKINRRHLRRLISEEIEKLARAGTKAAAQSYDIPTSKADIPKSASQAYHEINQRINRNLHKRGMGGVAVNIMDMIKNGELEPENPVLKKIFKFHSMPEPKSAKWGKMMGRAGSEWGLIGLAIGVPHLFIDDYIDSQKGDRMARKLSSLLRKPIELRDIKDPRKLRGASNIRAEGGSLKSNPILYLANQPNTNVAAELFKDDVIGSTVYKAIIELFRDRNKIAGYLDQLKAAS